MNIINPYIKQPGIGNINSIQSIRLPNSTTGSSSNIFSNFTTASTAFSMLHTILGSNAGLNFSFSQPSLLNTLKKFLTVKEPINNSAENNQALNNIGNEQTPKIENKVSVKIKEKQPQTENKAPVEIKKEQPQDITPKTVKEESKPLDKPIDPRLLAPTCYLIGPSIGRNQDLTPKQIQAREVAQAGNNEILKKLK